MEGEGEIDGLSLFAVIPFPGTDRQTRLLLSTSSHPYSPDSGTAPSLPFFPTPLLSEERPSSRGMKSSETGKLRFAKTWDGTDVGAIE